MIDIKSFTTNWQTTAAGAIAALPIVLNCYAEKRWPTSLEYSIMMTAFGVGGLAKDANVTGGTTTQPTVANPPTLSAK